MSRKVISQQNAVMSQLNLNWLQQLCYLADWLVVNLLEAWTYLMPDQPDLTGLKAWYTTINLFWNIVSQTYLKHVYKQVLCWANFKKLLAALFFNVPISVALLSGVFQDYSFSPSVSVFNFSRREHNGAVLVSSSILGCTHMFQHNKAVQWCSSITEHIISKAHDATMPPACNKP